MEKLSAKLVEPGKFDFFKEETKKLGHDEVLIKTTASGICSSEMHLYTGDVKCSEELCFRYEKYPADLGHEVTGVVENVGGCVEKFKKGDKVTGITYSGCGFSTHFVEKAERLIKVPEGVKDIHALGEPLMATVNILRSIHPEVADDVLIIGDGFMSLLLLNIINKNLRNLVVAGHHEYRLKLAQKYGATVFNSHEEDIIEYVKNLCGSRGMDVVVDLAGKMSTLEIAAKTVRKNRGKLVVPSYYALPEPFKIGVYLMNKGPKVIPAHPNYSPDLTDDLRRSMACLEKGWFKMEELVTHTFAFEDINKAFEVASNKKDGYIKGVITF